MRLNENSYWFGDQTPTVGLGPAAVDEGSSTNLTAVIAGGWQGAVSYAWDLDNDGGYGNDAGESGSTVAFSAAGRSGDWPVSVLASDAYGHRSRRFGHVHINPIAPTVTIAADGGFTLFEGDTLTLHLVASDPGNDIDTSTLLWDLDGDGSLGETGASAACGDEVGATVVFSSAALGGPGVATIRAGCLDATGLWGEASAELTIANVAPSNFSLSVSDTEINGGGCTSVSGSFDDPGALESHTVTIDWGDGQQETFDLPPGVTSLPAFGHRYASPPSIDTPAICTIQAWVSDSSGASSNTAAADVTLDDNDPSQGACVCVMGTDFDPEQGQWGDANYAGLPLTFKVVYARAPNDGDQPAHVLVWTQHGSGSDGQNDPADASDYADTQQELTFYEGDDWQYFTINTTADVTDQNDEYFWVFAAEDLHGTTDVDEGIKNIPRLKDNGEEINGQVGRATLAGQFHNYTIDPVFDSPSYEWQFPAEAIEGFNVSAGQRSGHKVDICPETPFLPDPRIVLPNEDPNALVTVTYKGKYHGVDVSFPLQASFRVIIPDVSATATAAHGGNNGYVSYATGSNLAFYYGDVQTTKGLSFQWNANPEDETVWQFAWVQIIEAGQDKFTSTVFGQSWDKPIATDTLDKAFPVSTNRTDDDSPGCEVLASNRGHGERSATYTMWLMAMPQIGAGIYVPVASCNWSFGFTYSIISDTIWGFDSTQPVQDPAFAPTTEFPKWDAKFPP